MAWINVENCCYRCPQRYKITESGGKQMYVSYNMHLSNFGFIDNKDVGKILGNKIFDPKFSWKKILEKYVLKISLENGSKVLFTRLLYDLWMSLK